MGVALCPSLHSVVLICVNVSQCSTSGWEKRRSDGLGGWVGGCVGCQCWGAVVFVGGLLLGCCCVGGLLLSRGAAVLGVGVGYCCWAAVVLRGRSFGMLSCWVLCCWGAALLGCCAVGCCCWGAVVLGGCCWDVLSVGLPPPPTPREGIPLQRDGSAPPRVDDGPEIPGQPTWIHHEEMTPRGGPGGGVWLKQNPLCPLRGGGAPPPPPPWASPQPRRPRL